MDKYLIVYEVLKSVKYLNCEAGRCSELPVNIEWGSHNTRLWTKSASVILVDPTSIGGITIFHDIRA